MKFRKNRKDQDTVINITSLVDLVFILLIFFAVTATFTSTSSIKVDLPKAKGEAVEKKKDINIAIDGKGNLYLDGKPIGDKELDGRLSILKQSNPDAMVVISADQNSLHGKVVFVMDKARAANFTRFAIATEEPK